MNPAFVTHEAYEASASPESIENFRSICRAAASELLSKGATVEEVVSRNITVQIPRKFLGMSLKPAFESRHEVQLRGWELDSRVTLLGQDGPEWYQHVSKAVLGEDGELYCVEVRREETNGRPTGDNSMTFKPLTEFGLWHVLDAQQWGNVRQDCSAEFPGRLGTSLEELLRRAKSGCGRMVL